LHLSVKHLSVKKSEISDLKFEMLSRGTEKWMTEKCVTLRREGAKEEA
jgi:hypothetical protein